MPGPRGNSSGTGPGATGHGFAGGFSATNTLVVSCGPGSSQDSRAARSRAREAISGILAANCGSREMYPATEMGSPRRCRSCNSAVRSFSSSPGWQSCGVR
jgi:hypothetical protein